MKNKLLKKEYDRLRYQRLRSEIIAAVSVRHRRLHPPAIKLSPEERFWQNVEKSEECWIWIGTCSSKGYGKLTINNRQLSAHRLSWELHYGPIPKGLSVLHKCDRRSCIRPNHLFIGTQRDNIQDAIRKQRMPFGENHHEHKLTVADVIAIRELGFTQDTLAEIFGVCQRTVSVIRNRLGWKHLP